MIVEYHWNRASLISVWIMRDLYYAGPVLCGTCIFETFVSTEINEVWIALITCAYSRCVYIQTTLRRECI